MKATQKSSMTLASNQAQPLMPTLSDRQREKLSVACTKIAPTWPLDELVAVNPWWEMRDQHFSDVSAKLTALSQAQCLMPKSYFQEIWMENLSPQHLKQAIDESGSDYSIESLERFLIEDDEHTHWHNISDFVDSGRDRKYKMAWRDEITHQISQFCADFFRYREHKVSYAETYQGLYSEWLATTRQDKGIEILMAEDGLTEQFMSLPETAEGLLAEALTVLRVTDESISDYAHALLLDINGWASWVAYLRWQDRLDGFDNSLMMDLLAIRIAWERVLWRHQKFHDRAVFNELKVMWRHQMNILPELIETHRAAQAKSWIWQRAAEIAYQSAIHQQLKHAPDVGESAERVQPKLQAAFCIDVRSEVIRRALEAQDPRIETIGFAGFFGLPIAYQPVGTDVSRPQLPALLKPQMQVKAILPAEQDQTTKRALNKKARWIEWGNAAPATFSMVEATGLLYAFKLLRNSLFPHEHEHPINHLPTADEFELTQNESPVSLQQKVDLAAGILHGLGLEQNLAETVMLIGHGSSSCNNPHAASYDCGACGGQTGEINVRVLSFLLNQDEVRDGLKQKGIEIPQNTRFMAAMHNTTTDAFTFYGPEAPDEQIKSWFVRASELSMQERAMRLGLDHLQGREVYESIQRRAKDWSQVRPEWGLSGNASFIVAPRKRTRGQNFQGRAFLHDYDWQEDEDVSLLTLIMTAPMVVTNWISLQYYASVCDNYVYGSGNKVLHNVVDGSIGVFEGNGGDLRIGLPLQSLHDGNKWMHEPLRLSVYIDAPRDYIEKVVAEQEVVRQLIDNEWLYCFRWDRDGTLERYREKDWISQEAI
ncbi:YbcC family protein [Thiomicrorhabdus heinhorstiae]|uniref:Probable inorganic carbon transporter subunit DabA n=1 Tax=Thiomicrorhabdus heinhorstiae TaxID=2748010 RepID=A0ABS0BYY1_9GAMM|nr:DUF2309 domain-containing protein [Thiomicrorhabdus heinhorstiae]MBF6059010.1 DUF2309 domain-containing protein [Thiomicrorhabdus heinhorstiae]